MKHREMGIAGCLGAIAGLAVAIVCEWSLLMLLPSALIGALTTFLCYRPLEVVSTIGEFGHDVGGALRCGMQKLRSIEKGRVWRIIRTMTFVGACVIVGVGSAILIPALAAMGGMVLRPVGREIPVAAAVGMEALHGCLVGSFGLLLFSMLGDIRVRWSMLLTRRVHAVIERWLGYGSDAWRNKSKEQTTKGVYFLYCLLGPAVIQVVGCLTVVALTVDAILTIILACASSERIAAILGATLGFCAGVVLHFCGVPSSMVVLAVGGTVGWFAGPLLYRLREHLAMVPVVETHSS